MNRTGWPLLRSPPTVLAVQAALGLWTGNGEEMWKSYRKRWNTKRIEEVKPGRADRLGEKNAERYRQEARSLWCWFISWIHSFVILQRLTEHLLCPKH